MSAREALLSLRIGDEELVRMFRMSAATWRSNARGWRALAQEMPDALKFVALGNAARDEIWAMADESRANAIEERL